MESQTPVSKRAPREFQNWRVQGNPLTLRQPFANPLPTFSANPSPNPSFRAGTRLETRVVGFLGKTTSSLSLSPQNPPPNQEYLSPSECPSLRMPLPWECHSPWECPEDKLIVWKCGQKMFRYMSGSAWFQSNAIVTTSIADQIKILSELFPAILDRINTGQ